MQVIRIHLQTVVIVDDVERVHERIQISRNIDNCALFHFAAFEASKNDTRTFNHRFDVVVDLFNTL